MNTGYSCKQASRHRRRVVFRYFVESISVIFLCFCCFSSFPLPGEIKQEGRRPSDTYETKTPASPLLGALRLVLDNIYTCAERLASRSYIPGIYCTALNLQYV